MSFSAANVLLDSTYILPSFGVEVEGLPVEQLARLREAVVKGKVKLHCLSVVWVELIGKICREKERLRKDTDKVIDIAVKSLLESGFYKWLTPTSEAVKLAFKLRTLGHRDNIDNLLYATSAENNMLLLTMDEDFKKFLSKNNFKIDNLIDHKSLLERLG
ncbi:MAG: PIN domain-containing protein [Candidatus Bathyarchaeia archaeon]